MARILLTGASGFIGREALRLLCDTGHEVHCIGRSPAIDPRAHNHTLDLMDSGQIAPLVLAIGASHCLHLAWYAVPRKYWHAPENLDWLAASIHLTRAFAASGGKRLVAAGTCAEYDWAVPVLDEATTPVSPATLYGKSKASFCQMLMSSAPILGLSAGWARVFNPYGPFDRPERLLGTVITAAQNGQGAKFSAGTQKRDFIHVDDVAAGLIHLLHSDIETPVNIGSGTAVTVRAFAEMAAHYAGISDRLIFGEAVAAATEPDLIVADTRKMTEELRFTPHFSIETGIQDAVSRALKS
ncbi:NAD-dependent epimerase/dehydratase family protein [Parasphingorhabdus halotolerans]|uniref:NAD(P)-dependent oxidoreductase n=1 Tax=Parasphingorhabdus halotolerans TaxID=2725558 RepID=A0A6H2DLA1_9SPHN|nr:NAD(P)-dependent oxidoreductase [Parasphingorhabdus halotolerans]QJB68531.1 NAD(P)-dependent oxidoreductase [Parasphingorhabdus halotolerans]